MMAAFLEHASGIPLPKQKRLCEAMQYKLQLWCADGSRPFLW